VQQQWSRVGAWRPDGTNARVLWSLPLTQLFQYNILKFCCIFQVSLVTSF
jgi:hypothetical protein